MSTKGKPSAENVNKVTKQFQKLDVSNNNQRTTQPKSPEVLNSSTKQGAPSHSHPKPKSTQELPKKSEVAVPIQPAARLGISKSTEVPKPKPPPEQPVRTKQKIEKAKSTEGLLTHEETSRHNWTCEICELDETKCNCDDFLFGQPEETEPRNPDADMTDFYPVDEDVPPGVQPPGGAPWLCEICEQKQEDCHCDDYFDLEDNEPLYQQQQQQQQQNRRNHSRSTSSPPHAAAGTGTTPKNICAFYLSGKCRFANQCRDLHPSFEWLCPYFLRGNCKFGDNCNLGHINLTLK